MSLWLEILIAVAVVIWVYDFVDGEIAIRRLLKRL